MESLITSTVLAKLQKGGRARFARSWSVQVVAILLLIVLAGTSQAAEFDFPRVLAVHHVPSASRQSGRIVKVSLPISVRFHGKEVHQVREITIDIVAGSESLQVVDFAPQTQLTSEWADDIQRTVTTENSRSLDATLGGGLPIAAGDLIAHVTPSISGGLGHREVETEKTSRLSPKMPLVVSGTTSQRRGVFFKLKPTSQTTLEGVHELSVEFVVPEDWQSGTLHIDCLAYGRHKLFGVIDQAKSFGSISTTVALYVVGNEEAREVALRRAGRTSELKLQFADSDG